MPRQSPAGKRSLRVGNYRADVDTTAMEPEMKGMFEEGEKSNIKVPKGPGVLNQARGALKKMGQGFGRLVGNRPSTAEEEKQYKHTGQMAHYNAKIKKDYQK